VTDANAVSMRSWRKKESSLEQDAVRFRVSENEGRPFGQSP